MNIRGSYRTLNKIVNNFSKNDIKNISYDEKNLQKLERIYPTGFSKLFHDGAITINSLNIKKTNDYIEVYGKYSEYSEYFIYSSNQKLYSYSISFFDDDEIIHDFTLSERYILEAILKFLAKDIYSDSMKIINAINDYERADKKVRDIKNMVGHITDDIDLSSYNKYEPYDCWKNIYHQGPYRVVYNDELICVCNNPIIIGEDYYSDGKYVGNHYLAFINVNDEYNNPKIVKVLDVTYKDHNMNTPEATLETYRSGNWEDYLHKIAIIGKEKKDELERIEALKKYAEQKEKERLEREKEYQKSLRFSSIDDRNVFKNKLN